MYEAGEKAVRLAPANSEVLGNVGQIMLWAGDCSIEELTDFDAKPQTYASGRCGWQTAFQYLIKAYELGTTNNFPYENISGRGKIILTIVDGKIVFNDRSFNIK